MFTQQQFDALGGEMGAVVGLEDERRAEREEETPEHRHGRLGVRMLTGDRRDQVSRAEVADIQDISVAAIDRGIRLPVVRRPDGSRNDPLAGDRRT